MSETAAPTSFVVESGTVCCAEGEERLVTGSIITGVVRGAMPLSRLVVYDVMRYFGQNLVGVVGSSWHPFRYLLNRPPGIAALTARLWAAAKPTASSR